MINSDCFLSAFTCPNSDHLFNEETKILPIPNLSCLGSPLDGLYHLSDQFIW